MIKLKRTNNNFWKANFEIGSNIEDEKQVKILAVSNLPLTVKFIVHTLNIYAFHPDHTKLNQNIYAFHALKLINMIILINFLRITKATLI